VWLTTSAVGCAVMSTGVVSHHIQIEMRIIIQRYSMLSKSICCVTIRLELWSTDVVLKIITHVECFLQTASPQDSVEVSTKQKKSSGKSNKPDSLKVDSSADLPVPSCDEFVPALPKARGKKKHENSVPKPR